METIINVCLDPPIRTYLHYAHPHGILLVNPERYSWLLNHYIQIKYTKSSDGEQLLPLVFDTVTYIFWPVLQCQLIIPNDLIEEGIEMIPFLKRMLDDGYAVRVMVDEFYIERRSAYQRYHFMHHVMIVGYQEEKAIFYVIGYTDRGRYEMTTSSMEELLKGLDLGGREMMGFFRDSGFPYQAQRKIMLEQIVHYVNSVQEDTTRPATSYGMEACRQLEERMDMFVSRNGVDMRAFYLLMEHKELMLKRLPYLLEGNLLCDEFVEEYRPIAKGAAVLCNRVLKYKLTGDEKERIRAHELLKTVNEREREFFERFLAAVDTTKG